MQYQIMYQGAFPMIKCELGNGERIKAEAGAMIASSPTIEVTAGVDGGIMKGLGRMLSGEKFFFQYLTATDGAGEVKLAHSQPGGIVALELSGNGYMLQKDGFLAATDGIEISSKMQNLGKGLFSGEGFFVVSVKGNGTLFVSSFGEIDEVTLSAGEQYIVDNSHIVAWEETLSYKIEKASKGLAASVFSGEGLVCRFTGPGKLYLQTRNPQAFASWVSSLLPPKS